MIGLRTLGALGRVRPERRLLFPPVAERDYLSVHVFTGDHRGGALVAARHFSDFGDIIEDPFTGSATGGMAAYCARYGLVREREYEVVQGEHVHRPGRGLVRVLGPLEHPEAIEVGGSAVTVLRGDLHF